MAIQTNDIPANVMAVLAETARQLGTTVDVQIARWQAEVGRRRGRAGEESAFLERVRHTRESLARAGITLADGESVELVRKSREESR